MPISTTLDAKAPVIRLTGEIDMQVAYALLDELKLLHDYYQFRDIELQIDSPGGNADALHHLVQSISPWRKGEGRTLRTLGLNEVASAAALLLSFGTLGHRCLCSHGRVLYHQVRAVQREASAQTVSQLRASSRKLERWDKCFLDLLVEHVQPGRGEVNGSAQAAYRRKLQRLFRQERYVSPQQAIELQLIDKVG
jgi:ATP-dependent protease ClpP protease subunit